VIHKLLELETVVLEGGSALLKDLAALGRHPAPDENALPERVRQLLADIEELAGAIEKSLPGLEPEDADLALGSVERVLNTWADIGTSIGRLRVLAAQGRFDERFSGLTALVAEGDPVERLGLQHIIERLQTVGRRPARPSGDPPVLTPAEPVGERPARSPIRPELIEKPLPPVRVEPPAPSIELRSPQLDYPFWPEESAPDAAEEQKLAECLSAVGVTDSLDTHAALSELVGRYRGRFMSSLVRGAAERHPDLERVLRALWEEPELVLVSDHLAPGGAPGLLALLSKAAVYPQAASFEKLLSLFAGAPEGALPEARLAAVDPEQTDRGVLLRALLVHPLSSHRRHAITELAPSEFWPLLACPEVPIVPLVEIADRLSLEDVSLDHQKIFLDSVLSLLAGAGSEPEGRAAGYVLERAARFEFAVEDGYYRKLMRLAEALTRNEAVSSTGASYARQAATLLQRRKDLAGAQPTRPPTSFSGTPLSLQRKLARQGLYLNLFVRHPDPRVALETLRFIDNPVKAEAVAKLPTANRLVIAEIAKRDELLKTYGARLALLAHPRASLEAAQKYAAFLKPEDLEQLTRRKSLNPEIALYLRERLGQGRSTTEH
jgi:hypothetical protein